MASTSPERSPAGLRKNIPLASLTTLSVGGPGRWVLPVENVQQVQEARGWAERRKLPVFHLGEGSNVLFSDEGFSGLLIQNRIRGRKRAGEEVEVGGGENLEDVIRWLNSQFLAGMERMFGIPGTVAGAVVGNAGAYGQEMGGVVLQVTIWDQGCVRTLPAAELDFEYRHTAFQAHPNWFILNCRLRLQRSVDDLQAISEEILSKRLLKYPAGLKCPGSFFKNVPLDQVSREALARVPDDFIMFGKIPAGKLLEAVGANGSRLGEAQFADYHGNLMINLGQASSRDMLRLAADYARRVWERFRIRLVPEVVIVDTREWPHRTDRASLEARFGSPKSEVR